MTRTIFFITALLYSTVVFGQVTGFAQLERLLNNKDTTPLIRNEFVKTPNWIEADKDRHFYYAKYGDTMTLAKAIKVIKQEKDFWTYLSAKTYCVDHFKQAVPELIALLTDTTKVGLINTADLIIWDRMSTKELQFYGHGGVIDEDIFTVAGRSSHILNELTNENFALVHVATTLPELRIYQALWISWFRRL